MTNTSLNRSDETTG